MLKTFELCPKKFYFKYIKNISMPTNDETFESGKNIHALASYYLKKENIDKMEQSLSEIEKLLWNHLKSIHYFAYNVVNTEYNLSFKLDNYFFGGRLDALVNDGEKYYILDYKTGSVPKNAKYDFQTIIYLLAVSSFFKTQNVSFVYIDLKNKDEIKIDLTEALAEEYKTKLIKLASKIEKEDFIKKNNNCNCEYNIICY
jgi:ATP-dependent exoDNAse (exonuclease V) beta subunit